MRKTALVLGAGGFIGSHLVKRLKSEGYFVRGIDLKYPEFSKTQADEFEIADLRNEIQVKRWIVLNYQQPFEPVKNFDEVYQLAADMGGAQFVFSGDHDADIMHNSALINLHVCNALIESGFNGKVFYSSSACVYPSLEDYFLFEDKCCNNNDPNKLKEEDAYPARPDSEYGWEKLFSERLYLAYARNHGLNVRIARFHNIYGPEGTYKGGREKAPAAICRKVIEQNDEPIILQKETWITNKALPKIDIFGDGNQTRSFLYIDDCIDAVRLLVKSDFKEPINIGSEEMVSINDLAKMVIGLSGKEISVNHIDGPQGVRGRNSDNTLIRSVLKWEPKFSLIEGIELTYKWIASQYDRD